MAGGAAAEAEGPGGGGVGSGGASSSTALRDFAAGTLGGMLGILAGHPLDTAKTRLQAMVRFEGSSTWRVIGDTVHLEGPQALYRGMSFPLYSSCLLNAVVFSVQGAAERALADALGQERARLNGFLAGCVAGLVQSPLVSAADLVKCQRQVQFSARSAGPASLLGPVGVLRHRVASLGVAQGCFQGLGATALKESPSYGLYFLVYEQVKHLAEARLAWHTVPATLVAGGLAGCFSLALIHPVDVVKSRLQSLPVEAPAAERSAMKVAADGLAREGAAFFLRGFSAAMQRAFVLNAATFGGYELAVAALATR